MQANSIETTKKKPSPPPEPTRAIVIPHPRNAA
jgi:hypothetical protein